MIITHWLTKKKSYIKFSVNYGTFLRSSCKVIYHLKVCKKKLYSYDWIDSRGIFEVDNGGWWGCCQHDKWNMIWGSSGRGYKCNRLQKTSLGHNQQIHISSDF